MIMTETSELQMSFHPGSIEHLGVRMYSTLPPILSELIANAYDADAHNVQVALYDKDEKKIIVKDDGIGMSYADIRTKFLAIGRNRRIEGDALTPGGRKPIGKKGLGKLSFFGFAQTITVDTVKDKMRNVFVIDWNKLIASGGEYPVDLQVHNEPAEEDGTTVELTNIKRKSDFSDEYVARGISRFFIFDKDFAVTVSRNGGESVTVTNKMRFDSLTTQFEWEIPNDLKGTAQHAYLKKHGINGRIITSKSPISSRGLPRGVALFSRQKLVQEPSYFAKSTSSHFFSYLSGWLEVDFIDDLPEDVISTNRQSLNWEHPPVDELEEVLRECIGHIQKEWRKKRKKTNKDKIAKQIKQKWYDSMPKKMRQQVIKLVAKIENLSSLEEREIAAVVDGLLAAIPSYPYYHWRHLHNRLHDPVMKLYADQSYFHAAWEAAKTYEDEVKTKSQVDDMDGVALFQHVFSEKNKVLEIQIPSVNAQTRENIQKGQKSLSVGLVESFRNPVAHNPEHTIGDPVFFTEDDCLDVLSLISFLLRRVDKAKKVKPAKKQQKSKKS